MESPPLPEEFFSNNFKTIDFLMMQRDYLRRALLVLKKRLPKEGTCSDPAIVHLVQQHVDLQYRLNRIEQIQLEKKTLLDSKVLLEKVGLPAIDPLPINRMLEDKFIEFMTHRVLFMDEMEKHGLKKKKSPPKRVYSPPSRKSKSK